MGILDFIAGRDDPSTADGHGLTEADRRQLLYGMLGQTGALLMAAGAPSATPAGNTQYLAQLANVPGNIQEQKTQMMRARMMQQQNQQLLLKNK